MRRSASARGALRRSCSSPRLSPQSSRSSLVHGETEASANGRAALTARAATAALGVPGAPSPARDSEQVTLGSVTCSVATSQEDTAGPKPCSVRVVVRFRPELDDVQDSPDPRSPRLAASTFIPDARDGTVTSVDFQHQFQFDRVFDPCDTQEDVYLNVGRPVVDDVIEGYHGTILAYGQTGSGKTYSMFGPPGVSTGQHSPDQHGIVPRAAREIFDRLADEERSGGSVFTITCSFLEIYCEQLRDLLKPNNKSLQMKEMPGCGFYVDGLLHRTVASAGEVMQTLRGGLKLRAAAPNAMNNHSSRSHAVYTLNITQRCEDGERHRKLTLVDLAGSEKIRKSGSTGDMLEEAKKINSSLSALGNVIDALADRRPHVPYRDSRLTRILEDSIGGNCRTTLLVNCSPSPAQSAETLSSLRFAARAKKVCNYVRLNAGPIMSMADRQLLQRIAQLQHDLACAHKDIERRLASGCAPAGSALEAQHRTLARSLLGRASTSTALEIDSSASACSSLGTESTPPLLIKSSSVKSTSSFASSKSNTLMGARRDSQVSIGLPANMVNLEHKSQPTSVKDVAIDERTLAELQAAVPNKGASREDPGSSDKARLTPGLHAEDVDGDELGWRRRYDRLAHQHVLDFANGGGRSGLLSAMSTATGSTRNLHSHSSLPMPLSPTTTPVSSWRNLDDNDTGGRRLSWLVEATPFNDQTVWYQKQLELERHRSCALTEELERRMHETQALQMELETTRAAAGEGFTQGLSRGGFAASSTMLQSPQLVGSSSYAALAPALSARPTSTLRNRSASPVPEPQIVSCRVGPAIPTGERRSLTPVRRDVLAAKGFRSSSASKREIRGSMIGLSYSGSTSRTTSTASRATLSPPPRMAPGKRGVRSAPGSYSLAVAPSDAATD